MSARKDQRHPRPHSHDAGALPFKFHSSNPHMRTARTCDNPTLGLCLHKREAGVSIGQRTGHGERHGHTHLPPRLVIALPSSSTSTRSVPRAPFDAGFHHHEGPTQHQPVRFLHFLHQFYALRVIADESQREAAFESAAT